MAPVPVDAPSLRDADDIAILECAVGGQADLIVSGDRDLLVLKEFNQIAIVTPATADWMFPDAVGSVPQENHLPFAQILDGAPPCRRP